MTAADRGSKVRMSSQLRNRGARANLGAYHLPPLGAGFFMSDHASRRSDLGRA